MKIGIWLHNLTSRYFHVKKQSY